MQAQAQTERESRVGKRLVPLPKGVSVAINGRNVKVEGPKGKLALDLPPQVTAKKDGEALKVESSAGGRDARRLQGLGRALLSSMVKGASQGYEKILELVGTGYRCEVKGKTLTLQLGLSHPASVELPATVNAVVPPDSKGTQLVLTSADKALLGQLAATIRALRPPEPYGGKGIRYRGETIRRKAGKAAKAKAK
jgi:large subunit ribosomal protein L6